VGALGEKPRAIISSRCPTNTQAMDKFGIAADHRFTMWDWWWALFGLVGHRPQSPKS